MATIFLPFQMGTLKLGRLFASRLKTRRLGEDNYSSMKWQFLLAQCVSSALATNQIAHYIIGLIELAMAHLGVILKAGLIGAWRI